MKFSLIPILLVFFVNAEAQDSRKSSFGFFIGAGGGEVIQEVSEGGGSMDLKTGISVELSYYRSIATKVSFETGLVLYSNKLIFDPPFHPNVNLEKQTENLRLLYIPVFMRLDVSKIFFLQGGLLADLDFTKSEYMDDLTGIGAGIGLGFISRFLKK